MLPPQPLFPEGAITMPMPPRRDFICDPKDDMAEDGQGYGGGRWENSGVVAEHDGVGRQGGRGADQLSLGQGHDFFDSFYGCYWHFEYAVSWILFVWV